MLEVLLPTGTLRITVGSPTPVNIEGVPEGWKTMALSYHQEYSAVRLIRPAANEIHSISDIATLDNTDDPLRFVFKEAVTHAEKENILGNEDPTILPSGLLTFTRVKASTRFYKSDWEAGLVFDLKPRRVAMSLDAGVLPVNLSYCKELEVIPPTRRTPSQLYMFVEAGGPGVGAVIAAGSGSIHDSDVVASLRPWLKPVTWYKGAFSTARWDSTHVSTGPIVQLDPETYLMFYNGRKEGFYGYEQPGGAYALGKKPEWACGVVIFKINFEDLSALPEVLYRSEVPLIRDEKAILTSTGQVIYFSSGIRHLEGDRYVLYGHIDDSLVVAHEITIERP